MPAGDFYKLCSAWHLLKRMRSVHDRTAELAKRVSLEDEAAWLALSDEANRLWAEIMILQDKETT